MSARNKKYTYLNFVLLLGLAVLLTCSDKIINNVETNSIEFDMSVKFSDEQQQELAEVVTTYRVTIIADDNTIVDTLEYSNGSITGLIENVPAGPNRVVIVEGLAPDGTVIYRGTTTITVVAGEIVDAVVTLKAVGKIVRISPKYLNANFESDIISEIKVDNLNGLTAIDLRVYYNFIETFLIFDSVARGNSLPNTANFTYGTQSRPFSIDIQVTNSSSMVDTSGDVSLARLYFSSAVSIGCLDSTIIDLTVNSLTAPAITLDDIYIDDAWVKVTRGNLVLTPDMLAFGAGVLGLNLDFKQVSVTDSCGNRIAFTISTQTDWIDLNTAQAGLTPGNIFIDVDTTGLTSGFYEGTVTISAPRAINSPYDIDVTLEIDKGARILDVIPDTLYFVATENGELPLSQNFRTIETNGFSISFDANESIPWLNLNGISGVTPDTITAEITTTGLDFGTYNGTIVISSAEADNSPQQVAVVYTVEVGERIIAVNPDSLHFTYTEFSDDFPTDDFIVSEAGGYQISYDATENISWLFLSDYSGTTEDTITVFITPPSEPGNYKDSIELFSGIADNSPIFVIVTLQVLPAARTIDVIPDTLSFITQVNTSLPAEKTFSVIETHNYATSYMATETISWLDITGVSGNTPDTITVSINSSDLEPGTYFDSIAIASTQVQNSPIFEYIEYIVTPFVDSFPPSPVTDLNVDSIATASAFLSWTSSGDDDTNGTASETDIRYSTNLSTLLNWTGATQADGESSPLASGSYEDFEVTGLTPGNTYYIALDIIDDVGNRSGISNVDSVYLPLLSPDVPQLVSPENNANNVAINVTFLWHIATGASIYELQFDIDASFGEPSVFSNINDTALSTEPLDYETTYYWRVRASNDDANSDWSSVWSFTTERRPPTIAGIVNDGDGAALADVLVTVYDSYPNGGKLDSTNTGESGVFEFFNLSGAFELHIFKDGYYPQVIPVEAPDTNLMIFLLEQAQFNPSDQWIDLYCDAAFAYGELIQFNDVVEAYDPNGNLCGRYDVTTTGAYGFMPVYRDDPNTLSVDEGCETGDIITLKVNGETAVTGLPIVYPAGINQQIEACFDVTGEIPKFIVITEPAGGETYLIDSTITIHWSSTGISGPLVLYISNSIIFPSPLDTIDNDGEHTIVVPSVMQADDWSISLVDVDESVTGTSNIFTISAVELLAVPSDLFFHSTVGGCLPGQKQFTISTTHGFNIPFEIEDTVSWLSVTPLTGTSPAVITVATLANVLPLGTYERSLTISSPSAVNSPIFLDVEFEVGEYFCGDFNGDCKLGAGDVTSLINFLYRGESVPLYPGALNVDLCEGVDIADVDLLFSLINDVNPAICEGAIVCADVSNDLGARDSLKFVVAHTPSIEDSTPQLQLDLYLFNDVNTVNGLANGFDWDNPNMILDSVKYTQVVENNVSFRFAFEDNVIDTTNVNQRFLFAVYKTIFSGIPPSGASKHLASYYFTLTSWAEGDSIAVDTLTFNLGSTSKASTPNGSYQLHWGGAVIVTEPGR